MKKIILIMFSLLLGLLFIACDSDINKVTMSSDPTVPAAEELSITVDFTMANADSSITFSWAAADFGFVSSTTYNVQASPNQDFSADVATLVTTQDLTGKAKISDFNGILLAWGKTVGEAATVYYRVSASVTESIVVYSETKTASFTPYETLIDYPMLYVPGSYQGWSPGAENGRLYSYGFNSAYQNIIRFSDGASPTANFKITPAPNWDTDWGGTMTKSGNNYAGTLVVKASDFAIDAGTYIVDVDINALTINLTKTNDWGIIGDATANGWDSDQDMFYNGQRKMWEITTDLADGTFKFRADDGWDLNYGDTGADGTLDAGGDNISVSAGNYTIRFSTEKLTYTIFKN